MDKTTNKTFVVKRSQWQRGKGYATLAKATAAGTKRCCLGFYANQICGLTDAQLDRLTTPAKTVIYGFDYNAWGPLLDSTQVGQHRLHDSSLCSEVMGVNDDKGIGGEEREETLTALFAGMGITIQFTD